MTDVFGRNWQLKDAGDMKHRDVALWNRAYLAYPHRAAVADERAAALAAAIEAGWIVSPAATYEDATDGATGKTERRHFLDGTQIDDLPAAQVGYYGALCNALFEAAMRVPKA